LTEGLGRRRFLQAGGSLGLLAMAGAGHATADSEERTATDIEDWNDLNAIREDLSGDYVLVADLDAETAGYDDHVGTPDAGWDPLGNFTDRFYGSLDGNGNEISDLQIDRPETERVGLFGYFKGTVENVTLTDVDIADGDETVGALVAENDEGEVLESSVSGRVNGRHTVGGLVGSNNGAVRASSANVEVSGELKVGALVGTNGETVQNSSASGSVSGEEAVGGLAGTTSYATISDSSADVDVTGTIEVGGLAGFARADGEVDGSSASGDVTGESGVGGLVGKNDLDVTNCSAEGEVTGEERVGGLVGSNEKVVRDSTASGDVTGTSKVGGCVGANSETLETSSATGTVTGDSRVGGLVGWNDNVVEASSANGAVSGESFVGGLVGYNDDSVVDSTASADVDGNSAVGGLVGWNDYSIENSYYNVDAVSINGENRVTYGGVFDAQYQDWQDGKSLSIEDYDSLAVADGTVEISDVEGVRDALGFVYDPSFDWQLGDHVDLRGASTDLYLPYLAGNFDGKEYAVAVDVDAPAVGPVGFIGVAAGDEVTGVEVLGKLTGDERVGGLVGSNSAELTNSSSSVDVTGTDEVGGLVGRSENLIEETYATGSVDGDSKVGGLLGTNKYDDVAESYAAGPVTGDSEVGGLIGGNDGSATRVNATYWDRETSGQNDGLQGEDGEVTGLSTREMQGGAAQENMPELDFEDTWKVVTIPDSYPIFQWQVPHEAPIDDPVDDDSEENQDDESEENQDDDSEETQTEGTTEDDETEGNDDETEEEQEDDPANDDGGGSPGFGLGGALSAIGGTAYLLKRRFGSDDDGSGPR